MRGRFANPGFTHQCRQDKRVTKIHGSRSVSRVNQSNPFIPSGTALINFSKTTTTNASHRKYLQKACHGSVGATSTLKAAWATCCGSEAMLEVLPCPGRWARLNAGCWGSLPPQEDTSLSPGLHSLLSGLKLVLCSQQGLAECLSNQHNKAKRKEDTHKSGNRELLQVTLLSILGHLWMMRHFIQAFQFPLQAGSFLLLQTLASITTQHRKQ